ncbi:LemA protein [Pseudochelatococcus lubricantis]|uniref:LemA protein n=1 Tax=Pseudochelatococcus lubricantis TaxID=1538102 RepID=A0ABX0UXA5_9HYPH|nr:LemA family protein [Pseudochelatococcus lubricantis]NIJ56490.1 LemA protein [Pseudochelatococcus lubricantis]
MGAPSRSRVFVVVGVILVLALAFVGARFMNVPQVQSRATSAWGEVERQFKLRAYLTQDVIDAVRAVNPAQLDLIAALENKRQQVINYAADARTPYSADLFRAFMTTQDALSVELGKVLDMMQLYPERRAQPPVSTVLGRLAQSESRIVVARSDYARAAEAYNRLVTKVPTRWLAGLVEPAARPMITSFDPAALPKT